MADLGSMFGAGAVETFLGLPKGDLADLGGARVALMGAATATPYDTVGAYCAGGPAAIREGAAAYAANLAHMNFDLDGPVLPDGVGAVDCGDLPIAPAGGAAARDAIRTAVAQVRAQGAVPILLGGDDSVPIPFLEAYDRPVGIVQIDAHIDWRDAVMGERLGLSSTMRRASEMGHVTGITQVGQRGIGSARLTDVAEAKAWGVNFVGARALHRQGLAAVEAVLPQADEVVVVFDVDAFDPAIMPAAIGRTAGGLSYDQALGLMELVAARKRIVGMTLAEFMPERDVDGQGALVVAQFLAAALGLIARQV